MTETETEVANSIVNTNVLLNVASTIHRADEAIYLGPIPRWKYRRNSRIRLQSQLRYVDFTKTYSQLLIYGTLSIFSDLYTVTFLNIITFLSANFYGNVSGQFRLFERTWQME